MKPRWGLLGLTFIVVLMLDQLSKLIVESNLYLGEKHVLAGDFAIVYTHNDGVAFGALSGSQWILIAFTTVAMLGLLFYFSKRGVSNSLLWLPSGLLLGGAVGNLIDRVRQDAVTDFIKVPYWPVFNFADIAITVGVILLVIVIERGRQRPSEEAESVDER